LWQPLSPYSLPQNVSILSKFFSRHITSPYSPPVRHIVFTGVADAVCHTHFRHLEYGQETLVKLPVQPPYVSCGLHAGMRPGGYNCTQVPHNRRWRTGARHTNHRVSDLERSLIDYSNSFPVRVPRSQPLRVSTH
jgi:hypothetical protein